MTEAWRCWQKGLASGRRHLRRLFLEHLGAPPVAVAQTRRLHFAKKLIDETDLPFTEIAMASGFGSIRRFNFVFQQLYGRTPTDLRRLTRKKIGCAPGSYRLRLPFRPPYDWEAMLGFLATRAIPGVETVTEDCYKRNIEINGSVGGIEVRMGDEALDLRIDFPDPKLLFLIVERVRRLFDLAADPAQIARQFANDPLLAKRVERRPGLRVPGAWDGFELGVRAILGQQISVKAASTLAGRIVRAYGDGRVFPSPEALANARLEECGIVSARAATIRALGIERSEVGRRRRFGGLPHTPKDPAGNRTVDRAIHRDASVRRTRTHFPQAT